MTGNLYETLYTEGLISEASLTKVKLQDQKPVLFSVHWEIRSLLYIGVLLLTGGLGLLIYENIDSIGHQFVLLLIALICAGCFAWCFKKKLPFSPNKVNAPDAFFDYIILLGSITLLIFVGYLQYEYKVFGTNYGMATFIPMLALFHIAYYFDHLGILSMAIANLAIWMGVSVTPNQLLFHSDFDSQTIIFTYLLLGLILLAAAWLSQHYQIKKHFKFSYQHYGLHVTYIALLAGYFHYYHSFLAIIFMLATLPLSLILYRDAFQQKSFYFLALVALYCYIAVSSLMVRLFTSIQNEAAVSILFMYFIGSAVGFVLLLLELNKRMKAA